MRKLAQFLVRRGMRVGWRRGVVQGNRAWVVVGGLALLGNLAGRALAKQEDVVFREEIRAGETFEVAHRPRD